MPAGPPAVTVFQGVPPPAPPAEGRPSGVQGTPEAEPVGADAKEEAEVEADPEVEVVTPDAEPMAVTDAVRHEFDGGGLVAIEIEEAGGVTRLVRGDDGWSVHPG